MEKAVKSLVYKLSIRRDKLEDEWDRSEYFDGYLDAISEVVSKLEKILKLDKEDK